MRRILFLGTAALMLASPALRADLGPRVGPRPGPGGVPQAPKVKVSIEVDEKATEPRMLVPIQVMFGGGNFGGALGVGGQLFGLGGAAGAVGVGGALGAGGAIGAPPGNFGQAGALGQAGGQPGAGGQKGVFGELGGKPKEAPPPKEDPPSDDSEQAQDRRQGALPLSTMIVGLALTLSLSTGGLWLARRKNGPGGMAPLTVLVAVLGLALASGAAVLANGAPPFRQPPRQPPQQPKAPGPLPTLAKFEGVKYELIQEGDTIRLILPRKMADQLKARK